MSQDPRHLRRLPALAPPAGLWAAIEAQLQPAPRARRPVRGLAIAASLALLLVLGLLLQGPDPDPPTADHAGQSTPLLAAMAQSARLEAALRQHEQGSVSSAALALLLRLEAELAWLDVHLAESPTDLSLWQQRSTLLAAMIFGYTAGTELAELPEVAT